MLGWVEEGAQANEQAGAEMMERGNWKKTVTLIQKYMKLI